MSLNESFDLSERVIVVLFTIFTITLHATQLEKLPER